MSIDARSSKNSEGGAFACSPHFDALGCSFDLITERNATDTEQGGQSAYITGRAEPASGWAQPWHDDTGDLGTANS